MLRLRYRGIRREPFSHVNTNHTSSTHSRLRHLGSSSSCPRWSGTRFGGIKLYGPSGTSAGTKFAWYAGHGYAASGIDHSADHAYDARDHAPEYNDSEYDEPEFDDTGIDAAADDNACESEWDGPEQHNSEYDESEYNRSQFDDSE
jgi:hypothetical protein